MLKFFWNKKNPSSSTTSRRLYTFLYVTYFYFVFGLLILYLFLDKFTFLPCLWDLVQRPLSVFFCKKNLHYALFLSLILQLQKSSFDFVFWSGCLRNLTVIKDQLRCFWYLCIFYYSIGSLLPWIHID